MRELPAPPSSSAGPSSQDVAPTPSAENAASRGAREALLATAGLLLVLGAGKTLAPVLPGGSDLVFTAAAAFQLYVPLWLIQRRGELPESHRIHVHGALLGPIAALRARLVARRRREKGGRPDAVARLLASYGRGAHFRGRELGRDLAGAAVAAIVTFPAFAIGHHVYRDVMSAGAAHYAFTVPPDIVETLLKNTLLIALPEELFYRGFLETRLERRWPTRLVVFGVPLGRAIFVGAGLFALGHFLGEWNPARLGPFFPAFLFSALARRSGSIAGAVTYHGMSNAFSAFLWAGYR